MTIRRLRFDHPYLLLTLTALFWSGNMVLGRAIRHDIPPLTLAMGRWIIAFLCILPLAMPHLRSQWPALRDGWRPVALLGLLGVGGYNTFAYIGLQYTQATNAVLLNSFIPVATIAISWAFLHRPLSRIQSIGVALSFAGALTIIARGDLDVLAHLSLNEGDLWMLGAVLVWALYTVGLQWRPAGVHPMLMLGALVLVGLLALIPAAVWELTAGGRVMTINASTMASLLYVGIFPSFLGYIFYNRGVAEVGANKASLFIHLMPVFGTLLSIVLLGEQPQVFHGIGIALILSGIVLTTHSGSKP